MDNNTEIDISEYYQISLSSITFPEKYAKLIKRICRSQMDLNDSLVETIGDIVRLKPDEFSKYPGIGKVYIKILSEFKDELPHLLTDIYLQNKIKLEEISNLKIVLSQKQLEMPLITISLVSTQYQRLIKRISSVIGNINTVQDILNLDSAYFATLPAVGNKYVHQLTELQKQLPIFLKEAPIKQIILSQEQLETPLNTIYLLLTQYQKLIKRISSAIGDVSTVKDVIDLDPMYFSNLPAVGKIYVTQLIELQNKLPEFLEAKSKKSALFNDNYLIEFNEIDNLLLEDIESYLWSLDEMKMDIALSRWGFNHPHETLEEIAIRYGVTRERIRQFEKPINANFVLNLRIQPKVLWANIREKMTEDLTVLLLNLSKCFETDKLFYEFIELCCQVKRGSIQEIVFTKINHKIITQFFCTNKSPIELEVIIHELVSNYGYSKASAIHGIKNLVSQEKIEITEQGVYPKNLTRDGAVAHVLTFHPTGLPWKDITRIVNKKDYSSKQMNETRQAPSALSDSEYVYLSGLGTYRNLMFLNVEQFNIPEIIQNLIDYFNKNQLTILHLHDYYYQTKNQRDEIEYFTLRYLVKEYGEEYGLYFKGKSNVDSVSLDSEIKSFTQADVIIKVLNESKVAMTIQEIAERLRSKSINHAGLYISNLMEDGKVVRVDKMVYTTPEKAFSNVDTKAIMQIIQDIMNISNNVIVEADVFREYVNIELNLSYSKYFYSALVITQLKQLAWHRNNTLFSKNTIPYKSLAEICSQLYNAELSVNENVKILQQFVWITDSVAINTFQRCKWKMNH